MKKASYILTSDGVFISEDELFHGRDIQYIDLDPNELMHWKYIKRVKLPNGKYRYYYDSSYRNNEEKTYKTNMLESFRKSAEVVNAQSDMEDADRRRRNNYKVGDYDGSRKASLEFQDAARRRQKAENEAKKANDAANKALKKYNAMKTTEFVARTITKGLNAVSNLIYKLTRNKK